MKYRSGDFVTHTSDTALGHIELLAELREPLPRMTTEELAAQMPEGYGDVDLWLMCHGMAAGGMILTNGGYSCAPGYYVGVYPGVIHFPGGMVPMWGSSDDPDTEYERTLPSSTPCNVEVCVTADGKGLVLSKSWT